jgi:hypothetical protein
VRRSAMPLTHRTQHPATATSLHRSARNALAQLPAIDALVERVGLAVVAHHVTSAGSPSNAHARGIHLPQP